MKILLPENSNDITLGQYQKYTELLQNDLGVYQTDIRKIQIFTDLKVNEITNLAEKDREEILEQIEKALNEPTNFYNRFKIEDMEFGFIPNLDKITAGEFFDLSKYGVEIETLHNLMAVLFRPIVDKTLSDYAIAEYTGTESMASLMKQMPMSVVNGALFFFLNLSTELLSYTQRYTEVEQVKESLQVTTLKSGDGMQPSMN
jgi:hypothetical protein